MTVRHLFVASSAAAVSVQRHLRRTSLLRCSAVTFTRAFTTDGNDQSSSDSGKALYFHISPSGDWWTGPTLFAAKHLQPDYVKSIPIPPGFDPNLYFGDSDDEEEEEDDCDEYKADEQMHQPQTQQIATVDGNEVEMAQTQKVTTQQQQQQPKLKLIWEEKQQLLFQIYDEGEIPAELLIDCCPLDGKDGTEL